jgi:NTE family protein
MSTKQKKYAVVLSGGAFLGAYQLGALNYISQNWEKITGRTGDPDFDIVSGISVGSLNGALAAQGKMDLLNRLWMEVAENGSQEIFTSQYIDDMGKITLNFEALKDDLFPNFKLKFKYFSKGFGNWILKLFGKNTPSLLELIIKDIADEADKNLPNFRALADNRPLREKLKQSVSLSDFPENCTFQSGFVSLNSGKYINVDNKNITDDATLINCITASTAIPVMWAPVPEINYKGSHKNLSDGGLKNVSPLADAVKAAKADSDYDYRFIIINCHAYSVNAVDNASWDVMNAAARSLEIIMSEIFNNDLHVFLKKNVESRENDKVSESKFKNFEYKLIQPPTADLGNSLDTRKELIQERITKGFRQAEQTFSADWES